jgi:hypothetical protein
VYENAHLGTGDLDAIGACCRKPAEAGSGIKHAGTPSCFSERASSDANRLLLSFGKRSLHEVDDERRKQKAENWRNQSTEHESGKKNGKRGDDLH